MEELVIKGGIKRIDEVMWQSQDKLHQIAAIKDLSLLQVLRFALLLQGWEDPADRRNTYHQLSQLLVLINIHWKIHPGSLCELAQAMTTCGMNANFIALHYLTASTWSIRYFEQARMSAEGIWPYFAERLDLLSEAFGLVPLESLPPASAWENYILNGLRAQGDLNRSERRPTGGGAHRDGRGSKRRRPVRREHDVPDRKDVPLGPKGSRTHYPRGFWGECSLTKYKVGTLERSR